MSVSRRGIIAGGLAFLASPPALAASDAKLLQNRLELWANYARRTKNVMARLVTTRETSLLDEPLITTGSLVFNAPNTLVLRDDGLSGSSTLVDGDTVSVLPNQSTLARPPAVDPAQREAQRWLSTLLLRAFAPPPRQEAGERNLIEGVRVNVVRRSFRLELLPERGSVVRKTFRSLTLHLDPVVGAVTQIVLAQTQGDQVRLQITDHRQNVEDADVDAVIDTVRSRLEQSAETPP